jgi:ribosome-associated protein
VIARAAILLAMDEPHASAVTRSDPDAQARARALATAIATALDEANCEDIVVLDVRDLSQVADYFVIASGTSERQMRTAGRKAEETAEELGESVFRSHSDAATTWVALDLVDVVVHIFEPTARGHYDLEMLWGDADRVEWPRADRRGSEGGSPPAPNGQER